MSKQDKIALLSQNIPDELKQLNQWVVWKYTKVKNSDKPTKPPYNANTGNKASVTDPSTWCSFNDAIKCFANGGDYSGIGLVFTDRDKYGVIDLDKAHGETLVRQQKIASEFDSYSEVSPSGFGLHIIVKGKVPIGKRKDCIEVYSNLRYVTFTGNVYKNRPIVDCQDKLTKLWNELNENNNSSSTNQIENAQSIRIDHVETLSDEQILEICKSASNGEKFSKLYSGEWKSDYPSQSEADLALVNIIAYYTKNRNQIVRMFRQSKLGQRKKAARNDYVNWMVDKSFDQTLPPIDFDLANKEIEEKLINSRPVAQRLEPSAHNGSVVGSNPTGPTTIQKPPGKLGELAQFFYDSAPSPVQEIAVAGAIAYAAQFCGRAYNVSGTGLNQYVLCLAPSGMGKDNVKSKVTLLNNYVVNSGCLIANSYRGADEISSGQALIKDISDKPCQLSIMGEFVHKLKAISGPRANSSEIKLKQALLELYTQSGKHGAYGRTIYSEKEKNINEIISPSFSLFCEGIAHSFNQVVDDYMFMDGFLPRFLIIRYEGKKPYFNKQHDKVVPPPRLVEYIGDLVSYVESITYPRKEGEKRKVIDVMTCPQVNVLLDRLSKYQVDQENGTDDERKKAIMSRLYINVYKLAGLCAAFENYHNPVISEEQFNWASNIIYNSMRVFIDDIDQDRFGDESNETNQINVIEEHIREYLSKDWDYIKKYCYDNSKQMHEDKIIPHEFFNKRISKLAAFKNDKFGGTVAIKKCLQTLVDNGKLIELKDNALKIKYNTTKKMYKVLIW